MVFLLQAVFGAFLVGTEQAVILAAVSLLQVIVSLGVVLLLRWAVSSLAFVLFVQTFAKTEAGAGSLLESFVVPLVVAVEVVQF